MSLFYKGTKYLEKKYKIEADYEDVIYHNQKLLFGDKTVYIPTKKKIEARELGGIIPDGFLFDFSKSENIDFYLVEIELAKHSFDRHILPQITRFFGFFKNPRSQSNLIEKIFTIVDNDEGLRNEFTKYLGKGELYKAIKDIIEENEKVLLIIDENKPELSDIKDIHPETWDKMVKLMVIKEYSDGGDAIFTSDPDFETIEIAETGADIVEEAEANNELKSYTADFHLDGVQDNVKEIYKAITTAFPYITFNPQRYYISMRDKKNFAYIRIGKKSIQIVFTMPYSKVKEKIKHYDVSEPSEGVQKFYNAESTYVIIKDTTYIKEVLDLLKENKDFEIIKKR